MDDLPIPLTQSEAFEKTCLAIGLPIQRLEESNGSCLIQTRKFPILGQINLISRGPIARDPAVASALLENARAATRGPLFINANSKPPGTGCVRLIGGAELALIHLGKPDSMLARMDQKWRNQLRKAERSGLRIANRPLSADRHKWFLDAETKQQRTRGYASYPAEFLLAYAAVNKGGARLLSAEIHGEPVAAMLMLEHGAMATYQAGITTALGRKYCAHNLLLWRMMCDHQSNGGTRLDLGRADLSPGLRRFKLGSGAEIEHLSGTYWMSPWWTNRMRRARNVSEAV